MRHLNLAIAVTAIAAAAAVSGAPAKANIVWDLSSQTGDLGPTASYTSGGYTITATGWLASTSVCSSPTYCFPVTSTDLYGKAEGGDESGLGIASDPSGEHEIYYPTEIQIDVSQPYAAGLRTYQFEMGSSTQGEAWSVIGSNTPISDGLPGTLLYNMNTDELTPHDLSGYKYYWFLYTGPLEGVGGSNVLLYKEFAAIPEPATWGLMGLGFAALAFAGYRRANARALAA